VFSDRAATRSRASRPLALSGGCPTAAPPPRRIDLGGAAPHPFPRAHGAGHATLRGRLAGCPRQALLPEDAGARCVERGRANPACQRAPESHLELARAGTTRLRASSLLHGALPASATSRNAGPASSSGFACARRRLTLRGPTMGASCDSHPLPSPADRFGRGARERPRAPRASERLRSNELALARDARRPSANRDETRAHPRVARDPARRSDAAERRLVRRPRATGNGAVKPRCRPAVLTTRARTWLCGGPSAMSDRYAVSRRAHAAWPGESPAARARAKIASPKSARTPQAQGGSEYLPAREAPPARRHTELTAARVERSAHLFTRAGKDLRIAPSASERP
jgi:hypothetical protein